MDLSDVSLRLGELVEKYVPEERRPTIQDITRQQAALLVAHDAGLDKGKSANDRIRPTSKIIEELEKSGVTNAKQLVDITAKDRLGQHQLPDEIPTYNNLLTQHIAPDIRQALLAGQAAMRIESILSGGRSDFQMPRSRDGDQEPVFLKQAQTALGAALSSVNTGAPITPEESQTFRTAAGQAMEGANKIWQNVFSKDLGSIQAPDPGQPLQLQQQQHQQRFQR